MLPKIHNLRRLDLIYSWSNGAYTEKGDEVLCDWCDVEMVWDQSRALWCCPECDSTMDRKEYFNCIGANPPG